MALFRVITFSFHIFYNIRSTSPAACVSPLYTPPVFRYPLPLPSPSSITTLCLPILSSRNGYSVVLDLQPSPGAQFPPFPQLHPTTWPLTRSSSRKTLMKSTALQSATMETTRQQLNPPSSTIMTLRRSNNPPPRYASGPKATMKAF